MNGVKFPIKKGVGIVCGDVVFNRLRVSLLEIRDYTLTKLKKKFRTLKWFHPIMWQYSEILTKAEFKAMWDYEKIKAELKKKVKE